MKWRKRKKSQSAKLNTSEVPESIANYIAMTVLNDVFANYDVIVHSASARIIVRKKENRWHMSIFMARIET